METLRAKNQELIQFRARFEGLEDALSNLLSIMFDKAAEVSFSGQESPASVLSPSIGGREKSALRELLGGE